MRPRITEVAMERATTHEKPSRIVLVVGVDLGEQSLHLLGVARDLARGVDETEMHVVHVVAPESFGELLFEPVLSRGVAERTRAQLAEWEIASCG
jgi:hypothetical protein